MLLGERGERAAIEGILKRAAGYAEFNYGKGELATACRRGDAVAFMAVTKWVTEGRDVKLAGIQNAIIVAGMS